MKKKRGKPVITEEPAVITDLEKIKAIQKKIVIAIEQNDKLLQKQYTDELISIRAEVARKIEIEALHTELQNRDLQRKRSERITEKCKLQRAAIDALFEAVNSLLPELKMAVEKSKLLPKLQQEAMAYFATADQLGGPMQRRIPQGYLNPRLKASIVTVKGGMRDSINVTNEALYYLRSAYSLLNSLERLDSEIPQRVPTLFESTEEETK